MNSVRKRKAILLRKLIRKLCQHALDEILALLEEKRIWTRPWILRRHSHGASALLLKELRSEDSGEFKSILRMTPNIFDNLLNLVGPQIQKLNTNMREAIPAKIKLEITLDFLSSGVNYRKLSHMYRVSRSTISRFIPEVCSEIYKALKKDIQVCRILFISN